MADRGTGQPLYFKCAECRRRCHNPVAGVYNCAHQQMRTGRTRKRKVRNNTGRMLDVAHEYTCSCGHIGWSRHVDVLLLKLDAKGAREGT